MIKSFHLTISGRVQGVGFRYWAKVIAQVYRVQGIVKNLPDGKVYIEIEGEEDNARKFIENCYEGPSRAKVTHIATEESLPAGHHGFCIVR